MQVTTYTTATAISTEVESYVIEKIEIRNSQSIEELFERVQEGSATTYDIRVMLLRVGKHLTASELRTVEYALARARHREGYPLTVRQIALLGTTSALRTTEKQVRKHMQFLGVKLSDMVSNLDANRILCRLPEPDLACDA